MNKSVFLRMMSSSMALPPFLTFKPSSGLSAKAGAIVLFQEWWGINEEIKSHAQHIATGTGAEVFLPDLYKGKIGLDAEEASHMMNNLDFRNAVAEVEALCGSIRSENPERKIGVTGFCMGGALTLATAALSEQPIQACAPFYGIPPAALCDVGTIPAKTPILAQFGDMDPLEGFSDKKSVNELEQTLQAAPQGHPFEVIRYERESHAFMNTDDFSASQREVLGFKGDFDPQTQKLAWSRLFDFMKKHLD